MATKREKKARQPSPDGASAAREPRTSVAVGWSPDKIRQAEIACNSGYYTLASDLCESMFADERVSKCHNRLYSATTLPLTFQLPGVDADQSKEDPICQAIDADWWKMLPEQTMRSIVRWLTLFGAFLGHIDGWERDEETGRAIPIITPWSCRNLRNDPQHGWQANVSSGTGESWGNWETINPGDGNWILILAGTGHRAPYHAPWRGISRWWLLGKLYSPIDWGSSSERHGQGEHFVTNTLTGANPESDIGEELSKTQKQKLADEIVRMGRNGALVLPRGWEAELVTDGANTYQTFKSQTEFANMAIDIGLTGTNLTTEVSGGSFAAASVHASVDAGVMRGLLELIATAIREQVLVWWHRFNFATGIAPYPHWDTTPPEDKKSTAEARKADADAFNTYVSAGAQIDQIAWFTEGKVQLVPGASREVKKPSAPKTEPAAPQQPKKAQAKSAATAADDSETAFARGRSYIDALEQSCCRHAARELAPTLAAVLSAIEDGTSYEDVQERLRQAYRDELPPSKLLKLTEAALIMGQLAGRETVDQEFETEE